MSRRSRRAFVVGVVVLACASAVYAVFLLAVAKGSARDYLYLATGTNALQERGPAFLPPVLEILTFVAVALLVYSLLRLGTSTILALLGAAVFLTSSQVALVFMSAPLWDMITYVAPLLALLLALLIVLIPTWSFRADASGYHKAAALMFLVATTLTGLLLLIAIARGARQVLIGARTLGPNDPVLLIQFVLAAILFAAVIAALVTRKRILRLLREHTDTLLLTVLTVAMAATILVAPLINSRRSYSSSASMIMLILAIAPLFVPIKRRLRIRAALTAGLLSAVVVSSLGVGTVTGSSLAFYLTSGWQSTSQLVSGLDGNSMQLGIPLTDGHLVTFVDTQGLSPLAFLATLGSMFLSANLDYVNVGIHYFIEGAWSYPEPPVGVSGILWTARMWIVGGIGVIAAVAAMTAVVLLLVSQRRVALFLLTLIAAIVLLVGLSRPQMHQWWFLPIFGVWAVLYAGRRAVAWIRVTKYCTDRQAAGGIRRFTTKSGPLGIAIQATAVLVFVLAAVVSTEFLAGIVSIRAHAAALRVQDRAASDRLSGYAALPWSTISADEGQAEPSTPATTLFRLYGITSGISLLRVETPGTCGLAGLQFAMKREGVYMDDTQRFFVGDTPSTVAYLPVIPGEGTRISQLTVQGVDPACVPSVQGTRTSPGELPIVAWLPEPCPSSTSVQNGGCPSGAQRSEDAAEAETIEPPHSFQSYVSRDEQMSNESHSVPRRATSVSAAVLGLPYHGYEATDLWVSEWRQSLTDVSVRVTGSVDRGATIVGLEFDQGVGSLALVPLTAYSIDGSIFNRGGVTIAQCFNVPAGVPYRIFVGAITDLYSPSWNNLSLDGTTLATGPCSGNTQSQQWAPTLS